MAMLDRRMSIRAFLTMTFVGLAAPAIGAAAVNATPPILDPPSTMEVRAGLTADQVVHARDADGDPLTFWMGWFRAPSYMTVTTIDPGAGSASGNIHLAPTLTDCGEASGSVVVSDGFYAAETQFTIMVFPLLDQPTDMMAYEGATADQKLTVSGPDNDVFTFSLISGPGFMTVTTTSDSTGNVHLAPGFGDAGWYQARISATNGLVTDERSFQITVRYDAPPMLAQPADMHAVPYTVSEQLLTASDPDGPSLTFFKVSGPAYMWVSTLGSTSQGYVRLTPTNRDTGVALAAVAVTDGTFSDQKPFTIRVDVTNVDPVIMQVEDMDLAEGMDKDQVFGGSDPDGQWLALSVGSKPRFMSVAAPRQSIGSDSVFSLMRLMPTYEDSGSYRPTLVLSDGISRVTRSFNITVRDAYPGETSLRLGTAQGGQSAGGLDYEYSVLDGSYVPYSGLPGFTGFTFIGVSTPTPSSSLGGGSNRMSSSAAKWRLFFAPPAGSSLTEGVYENASIWSTPLVGRPAFYVDGSDSNVPDLSACSRGSGRFEIKRLVRRIDGSILSFWATFQQTCADSSPPLHGDFRYHVQSIPLTLVAPRWLAERTDDKFLFSVSAVDTARDAITLSASGLPSGANFVDFGGGQGGFGWIPRRGQQGEYLVEFIASSAGGLADTALTTIRVVLFNHAPLATSNGPYDGSVGFPVPFTAAGTFDPDGDSLSYHWTFGDGTAGDGAAVNHVYRAAGIYVISLAVSDGSLAAGDAAIARISEPGAARVHELGRAGPLRLIAGSGQFCVAMETGTALHSRDDVYLSSIRMRVDGLGSVGEIVADSASVVVGDADRNGIPDITACFSRDQLRKLFANVAGRVGATATIEVSLRDGRGAIGYLPLDVIGPEAALSVLVAPNPLNPGGTMTLHTEREGALKVTVFDLSGRVVRVLYDASRVAPGYHDMKIDGRDSSGRRLASGVYFYRVEAAEGVDTGRFVIAR